MPASITELTFRVAVVTETLAIHPEWQKDIEAAGMDADTIERGRTSLVEALEMIEKVAEVAEDHTAVSQVDRAVTDVYGWYGTSRMVFQRALGDIDEEVWKDVLGEELDGPDEDFRVLIRAWRFLCSIRTRTELANTIRASRPRLRDDLQRGWVLLRKAVKALQKFHTIRNATVPGVEPGDVETVRQHLEEWIETFGQTAAHAFMDRPEILGMFGTIPEGVGIPLGGTAYDVVLHERAKTDPPNPVPAEPCVQWGIGAGGNKENYWERS